MGWASLAVWLVLSVQLWVKPYGTAFKTWVAICHAGAFLTIALLCVCELEIIGGSTPLVFRCDDCDGRVGQWHLSVYAAQLGF